MRYMANSRPGDGVTPEQLNELFYEGNFSTKGWDLVRHRVVSEYALKEGDVPGVVLFLDAESPDEAAEIVNSLPAVQNGLVTFELEPIGKTMRF